MKEKLQDSKIKGLLTTGEWFQCQGNLDEYGETELEEGFKVPKGHAIFHVSDEGKIDLIIFAERQSLSKKGREPDYPVADTRILPRIKIDFGNAKGHERCPSCQHLLRIHQERDA